MSETTTSAEPEQSEDVYRASKKHVTQKEESVSWALWILGASCLASVFLFQHFQAQIVQAKTTRQAGAQVQKKQAVCKTPDVVAKQLNIDPFNME